MQREVDIDKIAVRGTCSCGLTEPTLPFKTVPTTIAAETRVWKDQKSFLTCQIEGEKEKKYQLDWFAIKLLPRNCTRPPSPRQN